MEERKFPSSAVAAGLVLAAISAPAFSAGFALIEQSASGLGNAYAGTAALAEDASTVWWNPAGMAKLPTGKQFVFAGHAIQASTRFGDGASVVGQSSNPASSGNGGDAGKLSLIPSAYFTTDVAPRWKAGLGINVPFGLSTKYAPDWIGRFQGISSEVNTLNVNPSVSWAVSDRFSLGGGINWQRGTIDLITGVNYTGSWQGAVAAAGAAAAPLLPLVGANVEGQNHTKLEGDAWGYNAGMLWDVTSAVRLGAAYRSSIKYKMHGTAVFTNRPALPAAAGALGTAFNAAVSDGNVGLDLKTPDSASASLVITANPKLQWLADVTWTGWAKIKAAPLVRENGTTMDTLVFNFRDTVRASFGANYKVDEALTFKVGLALDQTPVPTAESRTVRLPDGDRTWLAFGAKYRLGPSSTIDAGYAHLWVKDEPINNNQNPPAGVKGLVNGTYRAMVDILSVQYTYQF